MKVRFFASRKPPKLGINLDNQKIQEPPPPPRFHAFYPESDDPTRSEGTDLIRRGQISYNAPYDRDISPHVLAADPL